MGRTQPTALMHSGLPQVAEGRTPPRMDAFRRWGQYYLSSK